jgi:hypothetical protein
MKERGSYREKEREREKKREREKWRKRKEEKNETIRIKDGRMREGKRESGTIPLASMH